MATGVATAAVGAAQAVTIGSGAGEGELFLCSIHLQSAERAARVRGLAWSSDGDRIAVDGICAVIPDDGSDPEHGGELALTGHSALSVDLTDNNRLDFIVTGSAGVTWRGWLEAELIGDYSA